MRFKIGDTIIAAGSMGYIDFHGVIEIVGTTDIDTAQEYQPDFFDRWFGEKDDYYHECKKHLKTMYVGRFIEKCDLGAAGDTVVFSDEFLDLSRTVIVKRGNRYESDK